jgi:predicted glycoside hydrolase/deacetylase ChbG (UPF0249 family)
VKGKPIIINADDFGLSVPTSKGIIKAHKEGIVTSASFMATTNAFTSSLALARETPGLDFGIHLVATGIESQPVLAPSRVRSLVPDGKQFPRSWKEFLLRLVMGQIDLEELFSEFEAQILKLMDSGVSPSHLDSNQHIHLLPSISKCVLKLVKKYSIPFLYEYMYGIAKSTFLLLEIPSKISLFISCIILGLSVAVTMYLNLMYTP